MDSLICKACGGDIDPKTSTCRYCGTVYVKGYVCREQTFDDCFKPIAAIDILTPNEMRDYLGLAPIVEQRVIEGCVIEPEYIIHDDGSIKFTGMSLCRKG